MQKADCPSPHLKLEEADLLPYTTNSPLPKIETERPGDLEPGTRN